MSTQLKLSPYILRIIERHVSRHTGHRRACRCRHCANWRVRLKRAVRRRFYEAVTLTWRQARAL